jgi:hypothetical protein
MNQNLIYYPCFSLLVLSTIVLLRLGFLRQKAIREKTVDFRFFKTYNTGATEPMLSAQASRNFTNLFEVPTLFYMVCAFALITRSVDDTFLTLAWAYAILRYAHSFIHLTVNKILLRNAAYSLSWIVLIIMGTQLFFRVA